MTEQTLVPALASPRGSATSQSSALTDPVTSATDVTATNSASANSATPATRPVTTTTPVGSMGTGWGEASDGEDFDYIPVSPWAPISLAVGLIALTAFFGLFGIYVAFFGVFVGIAAVVRVRSSAGAVKGGSMAWTGLVLSVASFTVSSAQMYQNFQTEVPEGFARVNFPKDIAEKQFVMVNGHRKLHPEVAELVGTKVYLKGFMWATQDTEGLTSFILLKDNGECCFGGRPKSHDYIFIRLPSFMDGEQPVLSKRSAGMTCVELTEEEKKKLKTSNDQQLTTRAFIGMVAVAGVLEADVRAGEDKPQEDFEYAPVYSMEAELVEEAWTPF